MHRFKHNLEGCGQTPTGCQAACGAAPDLREGSEVSQAVGGAVAALRKEEKRMVPRLWGGAVAALREEEKLMVPRRWAVLHQLSGRRTDIPVSRLWAVLHQLSGRTGGGQTYPFPGCGRCCRSSWEGGGGRLTGS